MSEYLILMRLNPGKIMDSLGDLRKISNKPVDGVDLCYTMNIFGAWDVGVWINAEDSTQALEFVQKKVKDITGVTEVYTVPTFPHGNKALKVADEEKKAQKIVKPAAVEA
ncbi:MAG: hypothetical protein NWF10_04510 [Candidatus Bathyarchaeota archaeon]|nr:hypothetical protein [Candidatus Bathyarchaeota archaeon]